MCIDNPVESIVKFNIDNLDSTGTVNTRFQLTLSGDKPWIILHITHGHMTYCEVIEDKAADELCSALSCALQEKNRVLQMRKAA